MTAKIQHIGGFGGQGNGKQQEKPLLCKRNICIMKYAHNGNKEICT